MPAGTFGASLPGEHLPFKPKPTVTCYICGREYGSSSYGIHEKQCIDKYVAKQKKLPVSERRPLPVKPLSLSEAQDSETGALKKLDDKALADLHESSFQTFMEEGREACPHCGRKFLSDRLTVHLRSCQPNGFFAKHRTTESRPTTSAMANTRPQTAARNLNASASLPVSKPKVAVPKEKPAPSVQSSPSSPSTPLPQSSAAQSAATQFCTQCGGRFNLSSDKFCGQCGIKR